MDLKLTMACTRYDRNAALCDGLVRPAGIELEIVESPSTGERQRRARAGEFDACEFYTGLYLADLPYGSLGFTAVPVFVKRAFRHSYIYVNAHAGIRQPSDLHGRRIGLQTWFTSTALWARGLLAEEFGLDLSSVRWVVDRDERIGAWQRPDWLTLEVVPDGASLHDMLAAGELDAAITTGAWAPDEHPDIGFLFPDYAAREREYFVRTGVFPIMHTLLVRTRLLDREPWVAMSLYDAWLESKRRCYEWLRWQRVHQTGLWYRGLWEEERALAGEDPYPYGLSASRTTVDKMIEYAVAHGIMPARLSAEDVFHPSTWQT